MNGTTQVATTTLSATTPSYTFESLPKYDSTGKEIAYTLEEVEVTGYTSEITGDATNGYKIKNTQDTTKVPVDKTWVNADGSTTWPSGVTVYTVEEAEITGYTGEITENEDGSVSIKNTQDTTEVPVDKTFVNADGSGTWPDGLEVTVNLLADDEQVATATLTASQTSYTFEDLPIYKYSGGTATEIVSSTL